MTNINAIRTYQRDANEADQTEKGRGHGREAPASAGRAPRPASFLGGPASPPESRAGVVVADDRGGDGWCRPGLGSGGPASGPHLARPASPLGIPGQGVDPA